MAERLLIFEDGEVWLGGFVVPGVLRSQSVRGVVRFDEVKQTGISGTVKKAKGWEDADISLVVDLVTDEVVLSGRTTPLIVDCYEKLAVLNSVFRAYDDNVNPMVYSVTNRHLRARGVDQVVFAGLESAETDNDDVISCTLHFVEYMPPVSRTEEQQTGSGTAPSVSTGSAAAPELSNDILIGVE